MVKKISLILGLCIFYFTNVGYTNPIQDKKTVVTSSIIDPFLPFTDKENLIISRLNNASLVGNASLMLDYYRSLMQSFMSEDKQSAIISFSLSTLPKILVYQNYTFAKESLKHLAYRVDYFSRAPEDTKESWKKTIRWYNVVILLLERENDIQTKLDEKLVLEISEDNDKPSTIKLLQQLALGLSETQNMDNKFQYMYVALDTANILHNTEMYYLISTLLVKMYLQTKEYASATTRLNLLYQLFSNIEPSDYYRIKILVYFTQVFLAKGDKEEAYTTYLRAKEMLQYNNIISNQELLRLQAMLKQISPQFDSISNANQIDSTFFNNFIKGN